MDTGYCFPIYSTTEWLRFDNRCACAWLATGTPTCRNLTKIVRDSKVLSDDVLSRSTMMCNLITTLTVNTSQKSCSFPCRPGLWWTQPFPKVLMLHENKVSSTKTPGMRNILHDFPFKRSNTLSWLMNERLLSGTYDALYFVEGHGRIRKTKLFVLCHAEINVN